MAFNQTTTIKFIVTKNGQRRALYWGVARRWLPISMDEAGNILDCLVHVSELAKHRYGPVIAIPTLSTDDHERIDPISEIVEMGVHPDKLIIVPVDHGQQS